MLIEYSHFPFHVSWCCVMFKLNSVPALCWRWGWCHIIVGPENRSIGFGECKYSIAWYQWLIARTRASYRQACVCGCDVSHTTKQSKLWLRLNTNPFCAVLSLFYAFSEQSPKKIGDDIAKATGDWKGLKITVCLSIQNRQAAISVVPSAASLIIKALKEPPRDRKKVKNSKCPKYSKPKLSALHKQ